MTRSKAFFLNGGAGRMLCSIPALELYAEESGDTDFIIVCEGGTDMFKGHPLLHKRAYDPSHKNLFETEIKHRQVVNPEPYQVWEYYNQRGDLYARYWIDKSGSIYYRSSYGVPDKTLTVVGWVIFIVGCFGAGLLLGS